MSVETPSSPPNQPQRSKGTLVIVFGGLALVAFFICINVLDSKQGRDPSVKTGRPPTVATPTLKFKPLPEGTLSAPLGFTSVQGYKLTVAKGWRILALAGAAGTDLIAQAPGTSGKAGYFAVTAVDASKRPVRDPKDELPGPETFKDFRPMPAKSFSLDGNAAAKQEANIVYEGVPTHILQVFASRNQRAYNFTGICPRNDFKKLRPDIQQMIDSIKWTAPTAQAPTPAPI